MEHAIALAYLISCLLLAASFPIVLIRKNQNGTEDVFFAHIQGFLLLLLLALLFNMMLHYYQTVFAPAQRDTPLMLCNLLCDLCVFFWIEMQRCVVTSRLGSMVRKLCRLYLITYLSVWIPGEYAAAAGQNRTVVSGAAPAAVFAAPCHRLGI